MSIYFKKGKGWRYDFILKGTRYSEAWFKTKAEAKTASVKKREEVKNPKPVTTEDVIPITFFNLLNERLNFVKDYNSTRHYTDYVYFSRRWIKEWGTSITCEEFTPKMIRDFLHYRKRVSAETANKDLRYLKATFNWGIKHKYITTSNPTNGIVFFPTEKKIKYIPPKEDVLAVILAAKPEEKDYLWTIKETMPRVNEINNLSWQDVNFDERYVVLYTRKKKGGIRKPRKVPMTNKLHEILTHRFTHRDKSSPWVFINKRTGKPYKYRRRIMKTLCRRAGVKYFTYHCLRHFGASVLDNANVNMGAIQRILGHENRSTTEIYLHSIGESERDAMRVFEEETKNSHTDSHTEKKQGVSPLP
ncbi:MAG: tyrosine-type recombinase/integrase [bacterium]